MEPGLDPPAVESPGSWPIPGRLRVGQVEKSRDRGSGSVCDPDFPAAITITERSEERIAGRVEWAYEGEANGTVAPGDHIRVRFDVPIEAGEEE